MSTNRILVFNVPTSISEEDIFEELTESYNGIKSVKRSRHMDEKQTPKETIQIEFADPKDADAILQESFIKLQHLRCRVVGLKPIQRFNRISNNSHITNRILLRDVPIAIDVNILRQRLSQVYPGIKQVIRWCFDDRCQHPTVCVEVNFFAPRYATDILRCGFIGIGNHSYKVTAL